MNMREIITGYIGDDYRKACEVYDWANRVEFQRIVKKKIVPVMILAFVVGLPISALVNNLVPDLTDVDRITGLVLILMVEFFCIGLVMMQEYYMTMIMTASRECKDRMIKEAEDDKGDDQ